MNTESIDRLGQAVGQSALRTLVKLCPEVRTASEDHLEATCAAMRAKANDAVEGLLADAKAAPWLAKMAFASAVLSIAQAGIEVLRNPATESKSD